MNKVLDSKTLTLERAPRLLYSRSEPFASHPSRNGHASHAFLVDLPCALDREEYETTRIGRLLQGAAADDSAARAGPAPEDWRCPGRVPAIDAPRPPYSLARGEGCLVGGAGIASVGDRPFADELAIGGLPASPPHGLGEITKTRSEVGIEGDASILESIDELRYPSPVLY